MYNRALIGPHVMLCERCIIAISPRVRAQGTKEYIGFRCDRCNEAYDGVIVRFCLIEVCNA